MRACVAQEICTSDPPMNANGQSRQSTGPVRRPDGGESRLPQLPALLLIIFLTIWSLLAINPAERSTWLLENVLVILLIPALIWGYYRAPLTHTAYAMTFAFLVLHEIGAHHTYSLVPYANWLSQWPGIDINAIFGWERNHFDRLLHFLHGLLLTEPTRQVIVSLSNIRGPWSHIVGIAMTMSLALLYELIEWAAAIVFGGDLGQAYLGTQGDIWDPHKDMALATLGAIIAAPAFAFALHQQQAQH